MRSALAEEPANNPANAEIDAKVRKLER